MQVRERLEREVRVDRLGAVAGEQREVVHFARRAGLDHQAGAGAQALVDQVLVDRAEVASSAGIATCCASTLRSDTIRML